MLTLKGRTALVTGASRGIGKALAVGLARAGARVVVCYHSGEDAARETADMVAEAGSEALLKGCDVTQPGEVEDLVDAVTARWGYVDILVNSAGGYERGRLLDINAETWRRVLELNLNGHFYVTQAVARQMVRSGTKGSIVNITSVAQGLVSPMMAPYNIAKAGAWALTRQSAYELAPYGIRVNAIAPGLTTTDLNRVALRDETYREERLRRIPLGFIGEPTDHVGALLYLVSDDARYVTGTCIGVDGGNALIGPPSAEGDWEHV